jgi:uncharacterized protein (TIGR02687 family)
LLEICRTVEVELRLSERFEKAETDALVNCDVLPAIDECILSHFLSEIGDRVIKTVEIISAVDNRRTSAWYDLNKNYFKCLYYVAKMQNFYIANISGFHIAEPTEIWKYYTNNYFMMDSYYRAFHTAFAQTLSEPNELLDERLRKAVDFVEDLYYEWYLKGLTACWTSAIADNLATLSYVSELPKQRDFYRRYVKNDNRVFVIVSDALRYEVAAELAELLPRETKGKVTLEAMQAMFPGVTKFGMAALLPGNGIDVEYRNEKLDVLVDGVSSQGTERRCAILTAENPDSIAVQYVDLLRMNQQERRAFARGKDVVYIYHNTIDNTGEHNELKVFEACQTAITELINTVKIVVNTMSGTNVVITSDHGFLYTYRPLAESDKISRQTFSGDVYELGRRYALTAPGTTADYLLPVQTEGEIRGIPLKGFVTQEMVRIKLQGGGANYVHGGISLQEMMIPVIMYKNLRSDSRQFVEVRSPGLSLVSESRKVSNNIVSLDFLQKLPVGDKVEPSVYKLHFADENGTHISDEPTIFADRTSSNPTERVYRARFNLKSMTFDRNKVYRLVIANDTDVPEEIEFHVDIAFSDDFGF